MSGGGAWVRRLCWALLAAGLAAASIQASRRAAVEEAARPVELVADYEKFAQLARREGLDPLQLLARLREAGVTSVGVPELTLKELQVQGRAALFPGGQAYALPEAPTGFRPRPGAVYVLFADPELASWARGALSARLGPERVRALAPRLLEVLGDEERLRDLGLGFRREQLAPLAGTGLWLVPRLSNSPNLSAADIESLFATLRPYRVSTVLVEGQQVIGFPAHLDETARLLERDRLNLGVVETATQLSNLSPSGMAALRRTAEGRMVRVFSVPDWLLTKREPEEVVDAILRAVEERNLRVVYLRPMEQGIEPHLAAEQNAERLAELAARLRAGGFPLGPARPFAPLRVPAAVRLLAGLAVLAGGLLLVELVLRPSPGRAALLLGAGAAAVAGATVLAPHASASLLALGAAVLFPSLGLALAFERWRVRAARGDAPADGREGVISLLLAAGVSLAGGLLIAALLGERPYLLEWSYFEGVKATLTVPPLLAVAAFLSILGLEADGAPGWRRLLAESWHLAELRLRLKHGVALLLALGLGALLIIRSGNAPSAFIPGLELKMRALLESVLVARPRTKEFLFGYPALVLVPLFLRRGERLASLLLSLAGSVGLASLVNSFEHLRTPVLFSLWRSVNGVALGAVVGAAALALARWAWRARDRRVGGLPGVGGR